MPEFKTMKSEMINYGTKNFMEVSRKSVTDDKGTNEFLMISKGYYSDDGSPRYKGGVGIPLNAETVKRITTKLEEFVQ